MVLKVISSPSSSMILLFCSFVLENYFILFVAVHARKETDHSLRKIWSIPSPTIELKTVLGLLRLFCVILWIGQ